MYKWPKNLQNEWESSVHHINQMPHTIEKLQIALSIVHERFNSHLDCMERKNEGKGWGTKRPGHKPRRRLPATPWPTMVAIHSRGRGWLLS
jgi:hypothetical protein